MTWVKPPVGSVGADARVTASNLMLTVFDGANPVPEMVTAVPALPVAVKVMRGVTV